MSAGSGILSAPPRVLFTPLPDGGVLLDLETKVYFTLNATGAELWSRLSKGPTDRATLVEHLSTEFEVDGDRAAHDVDAWITELLREGLLHERP